MEEVIIKYLNQNMEEAKKSIYNFKAEVIGDEHYKLDYITKNSDFNTVFHYETKSYKKNDDVETQIVFEHCIYKEPETYFGIKKELESVKIKTIVSKSTNDLFMKLFNTIAKIHNVEKLILDDYFYNIKPKEISVKYDKKSKLKTLELWYDIMYGLVRLCINKKEVFNLKWNIKTGEKIPNSEDLFEAYSIFLYKNNFTIMSDASEGGSFNTMNKKLKKKLIDLYSKYNY